MPDQKLFIQLIDACKSNMAPCAAELTFKINWRTDKSQKVLWDSLDQVLAMMRGVLNPDQEYDYPWVYVDKRNGVIVAGHFHGYPNLDIQTMNEESFESWFQDEVTAWGKENRLTQLDTNPGKTCDSILTMRFTV